MQVRNLRNRLYVIMVCEWAWVSIPGERELNALSILRWVLLNQAAAQNFDMHMCLQLKFWNWYDAITCIMKTTFHIMEIT